MRALVDKFIQWDVIFFSTIFGLNGKKVLSAVLPLASKSGNGHLYPVVGLAFLTLTPEAGVPFLAAALIAFALELPSYKLIKKWIKRGRPFDALTGVHSVIVPSDQFSFPSGHTAAAFVMATLVSAFFPATSGFMFSWALLVGFSRIYVGVHYPTDILAGAVLGFMSAKIGLLLAV